MSVCSGSHHGTFPMHAVCVVLHDVAPATWGACRRVLEQLDAIAALPVTLLAVPRYHGGARDAAFEAWLRERAQRGDEVALHGFTHRDDQPLHGPLDRLWRRFYTRGEGEFAALPLAESRRRLRLGEDWLRGLGLAPAGFVAPAWLIGGDAWRALHERAFRYTCTLRRIHLLPGPQAIDCRAQVWSNSTRWRRVLSVAWNESLALAQRRQPLVRLELHPADADHALLRRSWQRLLRRQLRTRRACTLGAAARQLAALRTAPAPSAP